ncbi:MAG: hypothetical protein HYT87_14240 [Nitrospirae bacterium]|nr:hypothetical protein [Nitrospirota bacterium]
MTWRRWIPVCSLIASCAHPFEPVRIDGDRSAGPDWTRHFQIFAYGTPPVSYLEAVLGTGIAWSVYHSGLNDDQLAYTRELRSRGIHVAANFATMQGSLSVLGRDTAAADPEFLTRIASQDLGGNTALALWITPNSPTLPSHNDPEWQAYLRRRVDEQIKGGADAIHIDEVEGLGGHLYLFGFDPDSMAGFRAYLENRFTGSELASRLGIAGIDSFDYAASLRAAGAKGLSEDPNPERRREFVRFQLKSRQDQLRDLIAHARSTSQSPVAFAGNTVNLAPQYQVQAAVLDFLVFETMLPLPPQGRLFALHRLGYQLMRGGITAMFPNIVNLLDMVNSGKDWSVITQRFAESWAAQQSFLIPYEAYVFGGGTSTVTGTATVPAEIIGPMSLLAWRHRGIREANLVARVGLVYPFHEVLREFLDIGYAFSYTTTGTHNEFLTIGEELQKRHVLFDVIYAGDEELVPRRLDLNRLSAYDVLVIPPGGGFTEADESVLAQFKSRGGTIVHSATELDESMSVSGSLPEQVGVSVVRNSAGTLGVHIVNYDYDRESGRFRPAGPFAISVPIPPGARCDQAAFETPELPATAVPVRIEASVLYATLPAFDIYGLLQCVTTKQ